MPRTAHEPLAACPRLVHGVDVDVYYTSTSPLFRKIQYRTTTNSHCRRVVAASFIFTSDDMYSIRSTSSDSTVSAENQVDEDQSIRIQDTIAERTLNILSGPHLVEKNEKNNLIKAILQLHASIDEEKTRRTSGRIGNRVSSKANVKGILDLVEKARKKAALDIELEKAKRIKLLETRLSTNTNPRRLRIQDQKPFVTANRDPMECPYCQHLSVMITSVPEEIERENERQKVCHERKVSFVFLFLLYSIHAY